MTRDERINAMLEAFNKVADSGMWTYKAAMEAALAAAGVEEMVRTGIREALDTVALDGFAAAHADLEAIVARVMGK